MSTAIHVFQSNAGATGTGRAMNVKGASTVSIQISGTFVGTVSFQGTIDGTNWVAIGGHDFATKTTISTTSTGTGLYQLPVAGLASIRMNITAYTSGSITVVGRATGASGWFV